VLEGIQSMTTGTKSLLFGVHQFAIHPWFVAWAWWKLYGFHWDPRMWIAFVIHDWGYWGKPNMDGPEGELHPIWAANVMRLFGDDWYKFCLYHSRFLAKKDDKPFSRLCVADKLAIALQPWWFYLPVTWLTGELAEYMEGKGARTPAQNRTAMEWYRDVQRYCREWVHEHADGRKDAWTGTDRDLARTSESDA
jgi:hypothetical protein